MRSKVIGEQANEFGVIMPNHLASSLDDTLGDRARHLSDALGMRVVAFERTGTGSLPETSEFTPKSYLEDVFERACKLRGILEASGIERAIIGHDSAGALDSLALAASGVLPVERVIAIEPAGMIDLPKDFKTYAKWGRKTLKSDKGFNLDEFKGLPPLPKTKSWMNYLKLPDRGYKEIKAYRYVFTNPVGRDVLYKLAEAGIRTDVVVGELTHLTPAEEQQKLIEEFSDSSVNIDVLPGAEHGFAEPYHHFVHIFKKALLSKPTQP